MSSGLGICLRNLSEIIHPWAHIHLFYIETHEIKFKIKRSVLGLTCLNKISVGFWTYEGLFI